MSNARHMPSRPRWRIQQKQAKSQRFRDVETRASAEEAWRVWSRLVSRARSGESLRRGEARIIDPHGEVRETFDLTAAAIAARRRALHGANQAALRERLVEEQWTQRRADGDDGVSP